jgi:hypothetical protein
MKTPGFNAMASLYKTSGRYQATMYSIAPTTGIVAQSFRRASIDPCTLACIRCNVGYPGADWCGICWDCYGEPPWVLRGGGPWAG